MNILNVASVALRICTLWMSVALLACDESLPPRDEPKEFLQATYGVSEGAVEIRDSIVLNTAGIFVVSARNTYVEVLQDEEFARVDLEIWLSDVPEQRALVVALRRDLTDPSLVAAGKLTLRPNQTATFLKQWAHRTISGRWFWEFSRLTQKFTPTGEPYLESDAVRFTAKGKVQLFKTRAPEILPPIHFTLVYRIF